MKKILVTGGNGFIGSHVVDNLIEKGFEVTIFDRFKDKPHRDDVNFFLGDIKDRDTVFEAISKHDGVINLAGILGTAETVNNPIPSVEVNIIGAINVYDACKSFNKKCVQITVGNWFMNNSYAITKSTAERFALMYNKEHKTKIAIVRGLNAYGPRQKHRPIRKIIPNFIIPALLNKPITIYGDGEQIMDMIYVKDIAEILVNALIIDHGVYDKIFEAGTGRATTVNFIAELVIKLTGSKSKIKHVPMRAGEIERAIVKGDPKTLIPLNISPDNLTPLEIGLKETIEWYKNHLQEFEWDE
ncbi:MAG: NAD-dependent epimerase/dehydratase family protein [Candidatus Aenigmatarchaeota archaeon]